MIQRLIAEDSTSLSSGLRAASGNIFSTWLNSKDNVECGGVWVGVGVEGARRKETKPDGMTQTFQGGLIDW
jgi:hypothetical protein